MIIEWFTPDSGPSLEWFGQTNETLAVISSQGINVIASVVGPIGSQGIQGDQGIQGVQGSGSGDFNPILDDGLFIWCGDSTTQQAGGSGYLFDTLTTSYRVKGALENSFGYANLGGSGYTMSGFYDQAAATVPVLSTSNLGVNVYDYYGHTPGAAVSLNTSILFRNGHNNPVAWVVCFGINDVILNNTVGDLSLDAIADYIQGYLYNIVDKIKGNNPQDSVILRIPNPMTARPYNSGAGFPSPTEYPAFGVDLPTDAALVDKWNKALRKGYYLAANRVSSIHLWDVYKDVFGEIDTTVPTTDIASLGDLVHPSGTGYYNLAHSFMDIVDPSDGVKPSFATTSAAATQVATTGGEDWEYFPEILKDTSKYECIISNKLLVGSGSNYIDVGVAYSDFLALIQGYGGTGWIFAFNNFRVAESFDTSSGNSSAIGDNSRLFGVTVASDSLVDKGLVSVFVRKPETAPLFDDSYLQTLLSSREVFKGVAIASGNGYIDIKLSELYKHQTIPLTRFFQNFDNAKLYSAFSGAEITVSKTYTYQSGIQVRILLSGDYTSYNGTEFAFVWDVLPSEYLPNYVSDFARVESGAKTYVHLADKSPFGYTVKAAQVGLVAESVSYEVFRHRQGATVSQGTYTLTANQTNHTVYTQATGEVSDDVVWFIEVTNSPTNTGNAAMYLKITNKKGV